MRVALCMKSPVIMVEKRAGPAGCWNMGVEVRGDFTEEGAIQPSLTESGFLTKRLRIEKGVYFT